MWKQLSFLLLIIFFQINREDIQSSYGDNDKDKNTNKQLDYLAFNPVIFSHFRIWIAALGTFFSSFMECIMTAPSASNVRLFSSVLTHRSSAFGHTNSLFYIGGGDIITTLSPLTTIVPKSFELLLSKNSTESSNNKFMC